MDLILWRHAEAEPGEPDLGRRLTAKGIQQAERMAKWLDRHLPATARILTSPADRAEQTARALKRKYRVVPEIAPGATAAAVLAAAGWPDAREPVARRRPPADAGRGRRLPADRRLARRGACARRRFGGSRIDARARRRRCSRW